MDKLPFTEVYLHPLVKDKNGKKMSKSLGNVIDPLEVIDGCSLEILQEKLKKSNLTPKEITKGLKEKAKDFPEGIPPCGTDTLRFSLLIYMTQLRNINLDINRIIGYRLFCSKIWNSVKLALMYKTPDFNLGKSIADFKLSSADIWILTKLKRVIISSNKNLGDHLYGNYANDLYDFYQKQFCDIYIEASKVYLTGEDQESKLAALNTIFTVLDISLRLFHPMMPYITEELYQRLPSHDAKKDSIYETAYPQDLEDFKIDEETELKFENLMRIVAEIRSVRDGIGIQKNLKPEVVVKIGDSTDQEYYNHHSKLFESLTGSASVTIAATDSADPAGSISKRIHSDTVYIKIEGLIDVKQEILRLQKSITKIEKMIEGIDKKMSGKAAEKMPDDVKEENKSKLQTYHHNIEAYKQSISELEKLK
jgi:valyl-tRNA synthetase